MRNFYSATAVRSVCLTVAVLCLTPAAVAKPQSATAWRDMSSTRVELQTREQEIQAHANVSQKADERHALSLEAGLIKRRLKEGDFVEGDRVVVRIEEQMTLADTFTVHSGKVLELPGFGSVNLDGALWSEAPERVRQQVATYVKEPRVSVTPLVRIGIMGAVSRPGYYQFPTDMSIADALMRAGGPASNGDASRSVVRRGGEDVWPAATLRDAIGQGLTIEQMALRSGDEVDIPEQRRFNTQMLLQVVGVLAGVSAVVLTRARR